MIRSQRFNRFVFDVCKTKSKENEDKNTWEFYLHKVLDKSYSDFLKEINLKKELEETDNEELTETISNSYSVLNNFNPEGGG